jgi:hypothetical protein
MAGEIIPANQDFDVGKGKEGKRTKEPTTAPKLKIPQNQAKYVPFMVSSGYETMMVPWAVQSRPAQIPRKTPAKMLKPSTSAWTETRREMA